MNLLVRKYFVTNFELKIEMILESVEGQGKSIDIYVFRQSVKKISWWFKPLWWHVFVLTKPLWMESISRHDQKSTKWNDYHRKEVTTYASNCCFVNFTTLCSNTATKKGKHSIHACSIIHSLTLTSAFFLATHLLFMFHNGVKLLENL